ncbi:MAG: hypothetical protein IJ008_02380 [Clostridia bacterium]|nr:hypothetical protein [Clostridia bacterium]
MENEYKNNYKFFTEIVKEAYEFWKGVCQEKNIDIDAPAFTFIDDFEEAETLKDLFIKKTCNGDKRMFFKSDLSEEGGQKIYRGIRNLSIEDYIKCLKNRSSSVYRKGVIGDGIYFSYQMQTAQKYENQQGGLIKAELGKCFKVVDYFTLSGMIDDYLEGYLMSEEYNNLDKEVKDWACTNLSSEELFTFYAGMFGYDAINLRDNVCVYNLDKVVIEDKYNVLPKQNENGIVKI